MLAALRFGSVTCLRLAAFEYTFINSRAVLFARTAVYGRICLNAEYFLYSCTLPGVAAVNEKLTNLS
jgi:hypothetical protein